MAAAGGWGESNFPPSGSVLSLSSGHNKKGLPRYLQPVRHDGQLPKKLVHDTVATPGEEEWIVEKHSEGLVLLRPAQHPQLCLSATGAALAGVKGIGLYGRHVELVEATVHTADANCLWRPKYCESQWQFTNKAYQSRLQHVHIKCVGSWKTPLHLCVSHMDLNKGYYSDFDKWTLEVRNRNQYGAPLWDHGLVGSSLGDSPPPRLPRKWVERYQRLAHSMQQDHEPMRLAVVGARAGIGKSSLVNHLVASMVTEVFHNDYGSTQESSAELVFGNGQRWIVRDIPGLTGKHKSKQGCNKHIPKVKKFVKHYKLAEHESIDAIIYVSTRLACMNRATEELKTEKLLIKKLLKPGTPLVIVNTHATGIVDQEIRHKTLDGLGLSDDPAICVLNVDLTWDGQAASFPSAISKNRSALDFPELLNTLEDRVDPCSVVSQAVRLRLVHQQVDLAVAGLSKPCLGEFAWVLCSHSTLAVVAPFYGPVLETLARMLLMAFLMYEAVGLLQPGTTKKAKHKLEQDLTADKMKFNQDHAQLKKEQKRLQTSSETAKNVVETGIVALLEISLKEIGLVLGQEVFKNTMHEATKQAVEHAIHFGLPVLGAAISMCFMPHSYRRMAKGAKRIAYRRHEAWLLYHRNELGLTADPNGPVAPVLGIPAFNLPDYEQEPVPGYPEYPEDYDQMPKGPDFTPACNSASAYDDGSSYTVDGYFPPAMPGIRISPSAPLSEMPPANGRPAADGQGWTGSCYQPAMPVAESLRAYGHPSVKDSTQMNSSYQPVMPGIRVSPSVPISDPVPAYGYLNEERCDRIASCYQPALPGIRKPPLIPEPSAIPAIGYPSEWGSPHGGISNGESEYRIAEYKDKSAINMSQPSDSFVPDDLCGYPTEAPPLHSSKSVYESIFGAHLGDQA